MHQNAAHCNEFDASILALAAGLLVKEADLGTVLPLKGELTGVMEHQYLLVRLGSVRQGERVM